jgi:uncharacterized small protein (DUF1192 family)
MLPALVKQGSCAMEEDLPRPKTVLLAKPPFDDFSVEALRRYIADLQAEIARAEAAIGAKQGARQAAESFFRKG